MRARREVLLALPLIVFITALLTAPGVIAGNITFKVVDGDKPVSNAVLVITLNGTPVTTLTTNANGTATASLNPGSYVIFVIVGENTYKFKQSILENTTTVTLNIGSGLQSYIVKAKTMVDQYKYYLLAIGGFVLLVLFALLLSERKTPRW